MAKAWTLLCVIAVMLVWRCGRWGFVSVCRGSRCLIAESSDDQGSGEDKYGVAPEVPQH